MPLLRNPVAAATAALAVLLVLSGGAFGAEEAVQTPVMEPGQAGLAPRPA